MEYTDLEDYRIVCVYQIQETIDYVKGGTLSCTVGDEDKILVDSKLFIKDIRRKTLWAFDTTGKYLFRISPQGRGPGEFVNLVDFTLNRERKELILYASLPGKFLIYDLKGNFKYEVAVSEYYREIAFHEGRLAAVTGLSNDVQSYLHLFCLADRQITDIQRVDLPHICKNSFYIKGAQLLLSGQLYFTRRNDPVIYRCTDGKAEAVFDIDFAKYNPPASLQQGLKISDQEYSRLLKEGYVTSIVNVKETPGSFFFTTFLSGMFVIRKDSSRIDFIPRLKDEKLGIFLYEMIPFEDPDNRYIAFSKTIANLKVEMTLPAKRPDGFKERVRKMKDDDNPVLILYPVKLPA